MFRDRFIGGPLDGEERDAAAETVGTDRVRDRDTGVEYDRAPGYDTEDTRAWVADEQPHGEQQPVTAEAKRGLTLAELRTFVAQADREGWPDHARPRALAGWRMRLHHLELSERSF